MGAPIMDSIFEEEVPRARLALLLRHFSHLKDEREPWRVVYPLKEVLLLVTCATIAACDDFDDIVAWGEHHLDFLRQFSEFHFGIPCERWLRSLINRLDPLLFGRCFTNWVAELWPGRHDFIAIDGKTARRTHDHRKGLKALHTLSAYASNARLVLAQLSVPEKTNEITAIPDLLDHLAETKQLEGALVTIDAMGCQVAIAIRLSPTRPITCSPSRATNPRSKPMSRTISAPPRPMNWPPQPASKRAMVGSRPASTRHPGTSIGSCPSEAIRANRASKPSRPSSRSTPAPNTGTAAASRPGSTSHLRRSTSNVSPPRHGVIGASKACTGCSMSSSKTIFPATGPATAPKTWPSYDASHSIWCAPTKPREASKPAGKGQDGAPNS